MRRRFRKADIKDYDICVGSPSEVVERIQELIADGWQVHGEPAHFMYDGKLTTVQSIILYDRENEDSATSNTFTHLSPQ